MADDLLDLPPQTRPAPGRRTSPNFVGHRARLLAASVCIAFALYTAAVPVGRAFLRMQVSYTEGWNVYNAAVVAHHGTLYPASYGWTSVNYPALSFYIVAGLGHFSHDFLFTARAISLLSTALCGLLVGLIVWRLTRARWPAFLAGLYCFTLFCASAEGYVGMDDPQMFAQVFLMAGLFVYVCYRGRLGGMIVAALLLTIGANIKHNLIEFPLAVLLDLLFVSRRKAIQFAIVGGALAALSIVLNIRFGGPGFLREMLAPRDYSLDHLVSNLADAYKPIVVPALLALAMAFRYSKHAERRIVSFLFAASVLTALAFGGGSGVWINVFFGGMLSVAMLLGLFLGDLQSAPKCPPWLSTAAPLFLFVWLIIPLVYSGNWRPLRALAEARAAQRRFQQETEILAAQPGPALCESLLRCYYAQKPYLYDPFNATRLIHLGRLDPSVIAGQLQEQEFGAVQLDKPIEYEYSHGPGNERFVPSILHAVEQYYVPLLENEDGVIYVPNRIASASSRVPRSGDPGFSTH